MLENFFGPANYIPMAVHWGVWPVLEDYYILPDVKFHPQNSGENNNKKITLPLKLFPNQLDRISL